MSINCHPALDAGLVAQDRCDVRSSRSRRSSCSWRLWKPARTTKPRRPAPRGRKSCSTARASTAGRRPTSSSAGEVKVEDGKIVMSAGRSMSGITSTRQDLPTTNYELSYEAMRTRGTRLLRRGDASRSASRYITLVNGGWGGNVTGLSSLDGMDASENETTRSIQLPGQDLVQVPGPGDRQDDPLLDRRQGDRGRRITRTGGSARGSRRAGTSRWASPPGKPPAPCATSRSGRSRPRRSPRPTSSRNDEGCEEMQLISGRFGHLATGGWGSISPAAMDLGAAVVSPRFLHRLPSCRRPCLPGQADDTGRSSFARNTRYASVMEPDPTEPPRQDHDSGPDRPEPEPYVSEGTDQGPGRVRRA